MNEVIEYKFLDVIVTIERNSRDSLYRLHISTTKDPEPWVCGYPERTYETLGGAANGALLWLNKYSKTHLKETR